jgi:DNA mismatch endonuclease (patch repair protein)
MVDVLTLEQHRYNMSRIRGKNTTAEAAVRRLLRPLGYAGRYSIKVRTLPGCPDIVLPKGRRVIFVHRGYWHMHKCLLGAVRPKTNEEFWQRNTSEMQTGQEESPQVRKGMVGLDSLGVKRGMSFSQRS